MNLKRFVEVLKEKVVGAKKTLLWTSAPLPSFC